MSVIRGAPTSGSAAPMARLIATWSRRIAPRPSRVREPRLRSSAAEDGLDDARHVGGRERSIGVEEAEHITASAHRPGPARRTEAAPRLDDDAGAGPFRPGTPVSSSEPFVHDSSSSARSSSDATTRPMTSASSSAGRMIETDWLTRRPPRGAAVTPPRAARARDRRRDRPHPRCRARAARCRARCPRRAPFGAIEVDMRAVPRRRREALDTAERGQHADQAEQPDRADGLVLAADGEGDEAGGAAQQPRRKPVIRMRRQLGMGHPGDRGLRLQPRRDRPRRGVLPLDPERERLQTTLEECSGPRIEGAPEPVGVACDLGHEARRAGHDAGRHVGVAVEGLRRRVDDEIGTERVRLLVDGCREGRVDHEPGASVLRRPRQHRQVCDAEHGVGERLGEQRVGAGRGTPPAVVIVDPDAHHLPAERRQLPHQQPMRIAADLHARRQAGRPAPDRGGAAATALQRRAPPRSVSAAMRRPAATVGLSPSGSRRTTRDRRAGSVERSRAVDGRGRAAVGGGGGPVNGQRRQACRPPWMGGPSTP